MKDLFITKTPLLKYVNDRIVLNGRDNRTSVTEKVLDILSDLPMVIVSNSNSHNYAIGMLLRFPKDFFSGKMGAEAKKDSLGRIRVQSISFVGLYPGGNTLTSADIVVNEQISKEDYLGGLTLLRDIISHELDLYRDPFNQNREIVFSDALLGILREPCQVPSFFSLKNALFLYKDEIEKSNKKNEYYEWLCEQSAFLSF